MVKCLNIGKNIGKPIYRSISSNYLYFFIAAETTTTTKKQFQDVCSEFQEQIRIVNVYLEFQRGKKSEMWTVHSEFQEKKSEFQKKHVRTVDVVEIPRRKKYSKNKVRIVNVYLEFQMGKKKFRNVDCTLRIQEKTCENCGCKVEIPRRKNYSKKKVRIVRWQESNWIARRKSE